MLSRFHLTPERYGQTDRRTDGQTDRISMSISRISVLTRNNQFNNGVISWLGFCIKTFIDFYIKLIYFIYFYFLIYFRYLYWLRLVNR